MKELNQYISEKLKISKNVDEYNYHPTDRSELMDLLFKLIPERGNDCDLNDIDVSNVTNMANLFENTNNLLKGSYVGKVDISKWNVSNVTTMNNMFSGCVEFDCDLSKWDVSHVTDFESMFEECWHFKGSGLDKWDTSSAIKMKYMFLECHDFDADLHNWDVSNIKSFQRMFDSCKKFTGKNLDKWNINKDIIRDMTKMFYKCHDLTVDLESWDLTDDIYYDYMFNECDKIKIPTWYKKK